MGILPSLILVLYFVHTAYGLEAITVPTKLPTPRWCTSSVYDGEDSIYIIGGYRGGYATAFGEILRYNLTSESIEVAFELPSGHKRRHGTAAYDVVDNVIYYFGGRDDQNNAGKNYFTIPLNGEPITMQSWPQNVWVWDGSSTSVWDTMTQSAFLFGSPRPWDASQIIGFDKANRTFTDLLRSNPAHVLRFDFAVAVWDQVTRTAYILGGSSQVFGDLMYDRIFKWTADSRELVLLDAKLPYSSLWSSGAWDSTSSCAYVIGEGFYDWEGHNVIRFCPGTNEVTPLTVEGFPSNLEQSSSVYVPKLNRIYTFGGVTTGENGDRDDILYIDLK